MDEKTSGSTTLKAGATGVAAGGIVLVAGIYHANYKAILVLVVGVILVVALLLLYRLMLAKRRKAKSQDMGKSLRAGSFVKPREISDPEAVAKIADLQTKFEEGIEKFRAAGKDLYSLPWYLLVGEPGGGKSEAIRHCNVGFPPGLQEEQQGVGGTVNMNWWFTNRAIILDTAGRLMFDQVEAAATGEWKEFLKLLAKARPKCPVNGMLLVIPADSLIVDSPEKLLEKAGKIARQLDTIQRTLGVRFPVFVVITKSDRIKGFREFFDAIGDLRLQHQMMGWSNPAPLDEPFNPEAVDQYLLQIRDRLCRRRMGLLLDPVHTEDPSSRRTDQIDSLYAFPESLTAIAPRLRTYLETIFTTEEWSPKPLFLRGIYFTSSMREGSALDKELADLIGVPIESLPEGRVWEKDRPFFLRDLFLSKVFREKGLVTRASNAKKLQWGRKAAVLSTGIAAVAVLGVMTVFGARQLNRNIDNESKHWRNLSQVCENHKGRNNDFFIIDIDVDSDAQSAVSAHPRTFAYRGRKKISMGDGGDQPLIEVLRSTFYEHINSPVSIPPIFAAASHVDGASKEKRLDAGRWLFEGAVVRPLVCAARYKLLSDPDFSGDDLKQQLPASTQDVVKELLRLEVPENTALAEPIRLDVLFKYVLTAEEYNSTAFGEDKKFLLQQYEDLKPAGGWPVRKINESDALASESTGNAILAGVHRLEHYWLGQFGDGNLSRPTVQLVADLNEFEKQNRLLIDDFTNTPPSGPNQGIERLKLWKVHAAAVSAARKNCDDEWKLIGGLNWLRGASSQSLVALYQQDRSNTASVVSTSISEMQKALASLRQDQSAAFKQSGTILENCLKVANAAQNKPNAISSSRSAELEQLDKTDFSFADAGRGLRIYQQIDNAYVKITDKLQLPGTEATVTNAEAPTPALPSDWAQTCKQVPRDAKAEIAAGNNLLGGVISDLPEKSQSRAACTFVIHQVLLPLKLNHQLGRCLNAADAPLSETALAAMVAKPGATPLFEPIPLATAVQSDPTFAFPGGTELLQAWSDIGSLLAGGGSDADGQDNRIIPLDAALLKDKYSTITPALKSYAESYASFWETIAPKAIAIKADAADWPHLNNGLPESVEQAAQPLQKLMQSVVDALEPLSKPSLDAELGIDPVKLQDALSQVNAALQSNGSAVDVASRKTVLAQWHKILLPGNLDDARKAMANLDVGAAECYKTFVLPAKPGADLVTQYWNQVTLFAISKVAGELRKSNHPKSPLQDFLAKYRVFPLAPPMDNVTPLGLDKVKEFNAKVISWQAMIEKNEAFYKNENLKGGAFVQDYSIVEGIDRGSSSQLTNMAELGKFLIATDYADIQTVATSFQKSVLQQGGLQPDETAQTIQLEAPDKLGRWGVSGASCNVQPTIDSLQSPDPAAVRAVGQVPFDTSFGLAIFDNANKLRIDRKFAGPWAPIRLLYAYEESPNPPLESKHPNAAYVAVPLTDPGAGGPGVALRLMFYKLGSNGAAAIPVPTLPR